MKCRLTFCGKFLSLMMSTFNKSAKRQELNKLSESKVIKQCKKYNINIYKLSKKEMIDKLLIKLESKHKAKLKGKAIQKIQLKVTLLDHTEMLIHAIARECINSSQILPDVIAVQIAHYVELMRVIDTCLDKYKYAIQNHGTFISRKHHKAIPPGKISKHTALDIKYRTIGFHQEFMKHPIPLFFGVSKGIKRGTKGQYQQHFQWHTPYSMQTPQNFTVILTLKMFLILLNQCTGKFKVRFHQIHKDDAIGIIESLNVCKQEWKYMFELDARWTHTTKHVWGQGLHTKRYYLQDKTIYAYQDCDYRDDRAVYKDGWVEHKHPKRKPGDVIMIEVDMENLRKSWIQFYLNENKFGPKINMRYDSAVATQRIYYPFVYTTKAGKYQVLI